jgi:hypothetical protein
LSFRSILSHSRGKTKNPRQAVRGKKKGGKAWAHDQIMSAPAPAPVPVAPIVIKPPHTNSAHTLPASYVTKQRLPDGYHDPAILERHHPATGWTILGAVMVDYVPWVNAFEAEHPVHGRVWGDSESEVRADSQAAYNVFCALGLVRAEHDLPSQSLERLPPYAFAYRCACTVLPLLRTSAS